MMRSTSRRTCGTMRYAVGHAIRKLRAQARSQRTRNPGENPKLMMDMANEMVQDIATHISVMKSTILIR